MTLFFVSSFTLAPESRGLLCVRKETKSYAKASIWRLFCFWF
ncbi:phenylalanyl-tRNA synthetase (pheST) operon leader peptide [Providencia heimbachae]|nr:phenylalanyl-tRNA synthetase (pheST) operon leader peptide [Providencia heimbachae]